MPRAAHLGAVGAKAGRKNRLVGGEGKVPRAEDFCRGGLNMGLKYGIIWGRFTVLKRCAFQVSLRVII